MDEIKIEGNICIVEKNDKCFRFELEEILHHPPLLATVGFKPEEIDNILKKIKNQLKNRPLRKTFEFNYTTPIYVKMTPPTIVDGELVMENRRVLVFDYEKAMEEAYRVQQEILDRARSRYEIKFPYEENII